MTQMLPIPCDPGYGELGVQEGVGMLQKQAELFGYNSVPPIDLPSTGATVRRCRGVGLRSASGELAGVLADTAIGQYGVQATALQNAMVAAGIANKGVLMTPHLMTSIHDSLGETVTTYKPKAMSTVARRRRPNR